MLLCLKKYFATAKVDAAQKSEELREKIVDLLDKQREITTSIRKGKDIQYHLSRGHVQIVGSVPSICIKQYHTAIVRQTFFIHLLSATI